MNQLKEYHPSHIDIFELEDNENIELLKENTTYFDEARTVVIDGIPIFAIGMLIVKDGVANCWIVRTKHMNNHKKTVLEVTQNCLKEFAEKYNIIRWQTMVEESFVKWIEYLGFEKECELVGFNREKEKKSYLYRRTV